MTQPCSAQKRCSARMKPWNERSGRIWSGSQSMGRYGLAKAAQKTRGTVSAAGGGIKGIPPKRWPNPTLSAGLSRTIGAGDGVAAQGLDFTRARGLGDAAEAHLIQLLVDPHRGLVRPAEHSTPTH